MKRKESMTALEIFSGIWLLATLVCLGASGYALGQGLAQGHDLTDKMAVFALAAAVFAGMPRYFQKAKPPTI